MSARTQESSKSKYRHSHQEHQAGGWPHPSKSRRNLPGVPAHQEAWYLRACRVVARSPYASRIGFLSLPFYFSFSLLLHFINLRIGSFNSRKQKHKQTLSPDPSRPITRISLSLPNHVFRPFTSRDLPFRIKVSGYLRFELDFDILFSTLSERPTKTHLPHSSLMCGGA